MSGATTVDVLEGRARWACVQSDAVAFLRSLPDDSVDLLFTSPPYRKARTYGIDAGRDTEEWVWWMCDLVCAAWRKVKGLIAINCDGQTEDYRYHPTPYLLLADLHRLGFNTRRPAFFHRIGIPGSGGPDWLRADLEPVLCITRSGRLPWSDNTACGHPPKWAPGGDPSHRRTDGSRANKNAFGVRTDKPVGASAYGLKDEREGHRANDKKRTKADKIALGAKRPSSCDASPQADGDPMREQAYLPPALANPGNVVQQLYTADEVAAMLVQASEVSHHTVGGGQMGHALASENEAPFPLDLAAFFVKSFCPPNGVVVDCFSGSGTVCHAAFESGRRFVGADLRQSQVDLCTRRMASVTPPLFGDDADEHGVLDRAG